MRIALVVPVLSLGLLAGCSEEPKEVPFKPTDTKQFDVMKEAMLKNVTKKSAAPAKAAPKAETPAPAK
jgi:hypothetical protein